MWKLSCIVLLLIKIGDSSIHDHPGTEISRNFRNYENQRYRSEERSIEYSGEEIIDRRDFNDYSDEFEGEELIGKWRNSGTALEPKWRDGDSLPLVPFDDSPGQKTFARKDATKEEAKTSPPSIVSEKSVDPKKGLSKIHLDNEKTIDKIRVPLQQYERTPSSVTKKTNDRYSLKVDHDNRYESIDDSSKDKNQFSQHEKFTRIPATRLTNSMLYEADENPRNPGEAPRKVVKLENKEFYTNGDVSSSPYSASFQVDLNEYDLNDEEYQRPRPRKRRPPESYGFIETRPPTYSITWSTEKYIENAGNPDRISTASSRKPEMTFLREDHEKKNVQNRKVDKPSNFDSRRKSENNELKSLLKMQQIEGFSLSELLQRRNLTLNDLLGGKAEVLNALKSDDNEGTETFGVRSKIFEPKKLYQSTEPSRWRPNSSRIEKNSKSSFNEISAISRNQTVSDVELGTREGENVDSDGKIDSNESEDGGRSSNENEKLSAIVRLTQPIIMPQSHFSASKSNFERPSDKKTEKDSYEAYQNDENIEKKDVSASTLDEDEIMEFSDFTVRKTETTTIVNEKSTNGAYGIHSNDDSGSTLSIENILGSTRQTAINLSVNETDEVDKKVNAATTNENTSNSDVFHSLDFDYQSDQPGEIVNEKIVDKKVANVEEEFSINDDTSYGRTKKIDEPRSSNDLPKNHLIFSTSSKPYELVISEIEPEARAEIFELFSTGSSAKRLESLLKSRNMSIDELIELRQRGSSKVHLAEILQSRQTAVFSRNYKNDDKIMIETPGEEKTTETTMTETTTVDLSDVEFASTETKERGMSEEHTEETKFDFTMEKTNDKNRQLLELLKAFDSLPFSIRPDTIFTEKSANEGKINTSPIVDVNVMERPRNPENLVEIGVVEEIVEKESTANGDFTETNVRTNYSSIGKSGEKKSLSKVRPSIIASGAILGVTIVVFLAIFIVCRIKQKQKYTYRNTFSRTVFQGPAMTARKLSNSSSLNTIMVNVVATSTTKRQDRRDKHETDENFESKSDIENDSLDANDSWETIPDFMK